MLSNRGDRKTRKRDGVTPMKEGIRGESGQALIELAVGLTVFTTLLIGAAEFGKLAYASIEVTHAAEAGASYGAQNHVTASDTTGMQTAATQDGVNVTGISATASFACVCSDGSASTCASTDCSTTRLIESVTVNTTATVNPGLHVPGLPTTYTLHGRSVLRVVQ
jgi:Flp pilus assembly protein TadG